jgi:hypothetical protein
MRKVVCIALAGLVCCFSNPVDLLCQETETIAAGQTASGDENLTTCVEDVWPPGEVREYLFQIAGQEVGRQWNQLVVRPVTDLGQSYELRFKLSMDMSAVGQPIKMQMHGGLILTPQGRPLSYDLDVSIDEQKQKLTAKFVEGKVLATVLKGAGESEHRVPCSPDIFVVDNNMIGQWALMLGLLPLQMGEKIPQKIFVPQALMEMDIMVDVTGVETIEVGGVEEKAYVCEIAPIGESVWVSEGGKMIRLEDEKQNLIITLLSPDADLPPAGSSGNGSFKDSAQ